ncbi:MAG: 4Fe-4S cluster-binding domain-containing protein, partial [Oscillospiraceae bacterium]|nr:4Fe-4S cluster-binding domain-containing protein [Oscillospiraceae bacterium]
MSNNVKGRVHSFQSMGTVDGPGVRFVVFLQGCNLRCKCC